MTACPQCGIEILRDELLHNEGVCQACCEENQAEINEHNWQHDWWNSLGHDEREAMIRFGCM